jgi:PAS domain S-box-containing protein
MHKSTLRSESKSRIERGSDGVGEQSAGTVEQLDISLGLAARRPGVWDRSVSDSVRQHLSSVGIDAINTMLVVADMKAQDKPLIFANGFFLEFTGYEADEVVGRNCRFLQTRADGSRDEDQPGLTKIREGVRRACFTHAMLRNYRKDGVMFWNELYLSPVKDDRGELAYMLGVQNNISELVATSEGDRLADSIVRNNQDAMLVVHAAEPTGDGPIVHANRAFGEMTGLAVNNVTGQSTRDVLPICLGRSMYQRVQAAVKHEKTFGGEVAIRPHGGDPGFRHYHVTPVYNDDGDIEMWCHVFRDISERRQLESDIREVVGIEQKRIAMDLHDSVAQDLSVAALTTTQLRGRIDDPDIQTTLTDIYNDIRSAADRARSIAHGLMPGQVEEHGPVAALALLAKRTQDHGVVNCTFSTNFTPAFANPQDEVHLYNIAREAVANAIRHGKPRRVWIDLELDEDRGRLVIEDDGRGMPEDLSGSDGIGIPTMKSRAGLIDGQVELDSSPRGGVRVQCTFPYRSRLGPDD